MCCSVLKTFRFSFRRPNRTLATRYPKAVYLYSLITLENEIYTDTRLLVLFTAELKTVEQNGYYIITSADTRFT